MIRKLALITFMFGILTSCSPTEVEGTGDAVVDESRLTPTLISEPTSIPSPSPTIMPSSTPIPPEISEAAKQTYLAMLLIQVESQLVYEAAARTQSGELSGFDQFGALLAIAALIEGADQSIPGISPPESLNAYWMELIEVHNQTKSLLSKWFNEEIDSSDVVESISPVLDTADENLLSVELKLADEFNFDVNEITSEREKVLSSLPEIFEATPTPSP